MRRAAFEERRQCWRAKNRRKVFTDQSRSFASAGTVNKELNHLAHVIETGRREWGIQLRENPLRMVRRPSAPEARDG